MKFQVLVRDLKMKQIVLGRLNNSIQVYSLPGDIITPHSEPEDCAKKLLSEDLGITNCTFKRSKVINQFNAD